MATLNFPDPTDTQEYEAAGITWTWNATLGVWSAEAGGGGVNLDETDVRYLRVDADAGDQERVAGKATFSELTTHEDGVSVTGGDVVIENFCQMDGIAQLDAVDGNKVIANAKIPNGATNKGGNTLSGFLYSGQDLKGGKIDKLTAFAAVNVGQGENNYGFYSDINQSASGKQNYAFYSAGEAWNVYKGATFFSQDLDKLPSSTNDTGAGNGIINGPEGRFAQHYTSGNSGSACSYIYRHGPTNGHITRFRHSPNVGDGTYTEAGNIILTSATSLNYGSTSDYRLKTNARSIKNATEVVSKLKPYAFEFINDPDTTHIGFYAHELQEQVPMAVTGEKDAVDGEGNPEYQSVDNSKIVPLLTQALQEALERIEALEAAVADGGTKPTRKRKS